MIILDFISLRRMTSIMGEWFMESTEYNAESDLHYKKIQEISRTKDSIKASSKKLVLI